MSSAVDFILSTQHPDGGWGYKARPDSMSFVEPTAYVLLALASEPRASEARVHGLEWLAGLQLADGGWPIAGIDRESSWMTACAVWTMARFGTRGDAVRRGGEWLLRTRGITVTDVADRLRLKNLFGMDAGLAGWPWQPGDGSWVFPTALALLALDAAGQPQHARVQEGIAYLLDRTVPTGGWNIGNGFMLGQVLPATIHATAVGLLALDALHTQNEAVERAVTYLKESLLSAQAPSDLAWALWALRERGAAGTDAAAARLVRLQQADGSWEGNPYHTALAMLALRADGP